MKEGLEPILAIEDLHTVFPTRAGVVQAVKGVNLTLHRGEILGVVGESGSGKSAMLLSILGLVPRPGRIAGGRILFGNTELTTASPAELRRIRGRRIAMVFQDPMTTLNPVFRVGEQIREALRIHGLEPGPPWWPLDRGRRRRERRRVLDLMAEVGIPSPAARYLNFPHEFSGGMQQRAGIAIALACQPEVLLADEPTTALDVTIQAQIMALLRRINQERGTSIVLVTHDLALAAEFCDRIAVMYAGHLLESGPTAVVVERPAHPYTRGLLRSIPRIKAREALRPIPGTVPDLIDLPYRCPFHPRCPLASAACEEGDIPMAAAADDHLFRCIVPVERQEELDREA